MEHHNEDISTFLATPHRQSPVAILLILLKFAKILGRQAWIILVILFLNPQKLQESWIVGIIIGVAFISAMVSITSYFKFYFYIKENELIIEKGLFKKTKLNIPLGRIQTVNFNQNVIHQAFNVVGIELDTAGSKGNEFSISALKKEKAEAIRSFLIAKRQEIKGETDEIGEEQAVGKQEKVLLNLQVADLLKVGVGENHFKMLGIIFGTLYGLYELLSNVIGDKNAYSIIEGEVIKIGSDTFFMIAIPVLLILTFVLSLGSTIFKYYNLQFIRTSNGFKVIAGLFNRQERSANMDKIQIIKWGNNPIKMLFKMFNLRLAQASSTVVNSKQSIYVPGCYASQLEEVKVTYFPDIQHQNFLSHRISRVVIMRRVLYLGMLPALPLTLFNVWGNGWTGLWPILWVLVVYWASRRYYQKWRYWVSEDGLQITHGIIGTSNALLKWYKVQAIQIRQSIYQRRKGLANIYFYTAAGRINIPYIELEKAQILQDYVLYKVESNQKRWM